MLFSYGYGQQQIGDNKENAGELLAISIAIRMRRYNAGASPDRARPGFHSELLDAAIRQVHAPYCPGGRHGQQICWNNTKH